ncbi:CD82 antigen [Trichonephila inaurata madagascariensis]|uniref:Tetraspanin n=1 Tax=Trichonephila inaurata madagascariensis TaxID=2747483 RepID=A0A8X6YBG7_9ARAC|nr:CD82 antigen [Trichonephila inaurata madagascariensis]
MGLSCGARCAKGFLVTFNLIFWISGCFIFAVGVYLLVDKEKVTVFHLVTEPGLSYALDQYLAWALVGIGGLVFFGGFCGCCGAIRENRALLVTYFIFLFLIMGAELAVGILSVIFQNQTINRLGELSTLLKEEYGINGQTTEAFDFAQTKFNCCGIFGPQDYEGSNWMTQDLGKGDIVAKTCCILSNTDHLDPKPVNSSWCQSDKAAEHIAFRHEEGCLDKLDDFLRNITILLVAIGCGAAALEIFGMIFSICLCKEV